MRVSQLFVAAGLAAVVTAGIPGNGENVASSLDLTSSHTPLPVVTAVGVEPSSQEPSNATIVASSHSPQTSAVPANQSTTHTTGTCLELDSRHCASERPGNTNTSAPVHSTATSESTPHANATSSKPADATGGAILPQMQGSMAGLLGFCIMSLMLL